MKPLLGETPRPLGALVMLPICELTGSEHLKRAHRRIRHLFADIDSHREPARAELLKNINHEITFHDEYEDTVYYPFAFEVLGEHNDIVNEVAEQHDKIRDLLKRTHQEDPEIFEEKLEDELKETVVHHIDDEEKKLIPTVEKKLTLQPPRYWAAVMSR